MTTAGGTPRKLLCAAAAAGALALILLLPRPADIVNDDQIISLSSQGKATLAVLAMAVILWMTEAVAFPVTGLLAVVVLVMTGAASFEEAVRDGFGSHIILFFIGVLIFSAAIAETSLLRRLTTLLLYHLGHKPRAMILVILVVGALLSGWITDMAVAAVLLPVGMSILKDAKLRPMESNFGKALMISCAWGPLIGGVATPAGCGPNPLTMEYMRDLAKVEFSFLDWMAVGSYKCIY